MFSNNEAAQGCIGLVSMEILASEENAVNFIISGHSHALDIVVFDTAFPNLKKFQLCYDWVGCSQITIHLLNASG